MSEVAGLIARVRASEAGQQVKILVGGYPFKVSAGLWRSVNADGFGSDAQQAITIATGWVASWTDMLTTGLAWVCDRAGVIQHILWDDLSSTAADALGQTVIDRVDADSRDKAGYLLAEIQTQGAAFDWELNVPVGSRVVMLHFSGVTNGDSLVLLAARNRNDLVQLSEELMRVNNEQVNALRAVIKDQTAQALIQDNRDHGVYDELTRLNNDLIGLQRELAKTNAELEHLNQQKTQFLGMAAHDLRNPLGVILAYSEFLSDEIDPGTGRIRPRHPPVQRIHAAPHQ